MVREKAVPPGGGDILPRNGGGGIGHSNSLWSEGVAVHTVSFMLQWLLGNFQGRMP